MTEEFRISRTPEEVEAARTRVDGCFVREVENKARIIRTQINEFERIVLSNFDDNFGADDLLALRRAAEFLEEMANGLTFLVTKEIQKNYYEFVTGEPSPSRAVEERKRRETGQWRIDE